MARQDVAKKVLREKEAALTKLDAILLRLLSFCASLSPISSLSLVIIIVIIITDHSPPFSPFLGRWLPGSSGCVYFDETMMSSGMKALLPRGLDICYTPAMYLHKPWYEKYSRREREAILPLMLYARYRSKKWYVVADDQTLFSPLALAQWLGGFDPFEEWYIGSVSESEELRKRSGWWDTARIGGGIAFSSGLLTHYGAGLSACLDEAPWRQAQATGGDWVLSRCLSLLGIPLTHAPGMHPIDMGSDKDHSTASLSPSSSSSSPLLAEAEALRDVLERHPIAPFLSLHHPARVFLPATGLDHASFFRAMFHDPVNFCGLVVCEVRARNQSYTAAVSVGVSVRFWPGKSFRRRRRGGGGSGSGSGSSSSRGRHMQPTMLLGKRSIALFFSTKSPP